MSYTTTQIIHTMSIQVAIHDSSNLNSWTDTTFYDGDKVWVAGYYHSSSGYRCTLNFVPEEVTWSDKHNYWLNNKGKQVYIGGYGVWVFQTQAEAIQHYNNQVDAHMKHLLTKVTKLTKAITLCKKRISGKSKYLNDAIKTLHETIQTFQE